MSFINEYNRLKFSYDNKINNEVIEKIKNLKNNNMVIAFCGNFKSGKSSLINALLERRILPTKTNTATGIVTRVYYSEKSEAYIIEKNEDGSLCKKEIGIEDINNYILVKQKTLYEISRLDILEVGIGIKNEILKSGIEIIDTPGLDDDDDLTDSTMNILYRADIVVIVYNAVQFMSKEEKIFTKEINSLTGGNILFVVNRIDQVQEIDSIKSAADYYLCNFGNSLVGFNSTAYTSAKENSQEIEELKNLLKIVKSDKRKEIIYYSRLNILVNLMEISMNEDLYKWEEFRDIYQEYEEKREVKVNGLSKNMNMKMMYLCKRINGVKFNIWKYMETFASTCLTIATKEGLLKNNQFNSYLLSHCIEKTSQIFNEQFQMKLEKLLNEFDVNLEIKFNCNPISKPSKIEMYLLKTSKFGGGEIGKSELNIFGKAYFNDFEKLSNDGKNNKFLLVYMKAVEDEMDNLKLEINRLLEDLEYKVVKLKENYNPEVEIPKNIQEVYYSMIECNKSVVWYRENINSVNNVLGISQK